MAASDFYHNKGTEGTGAGKKLASYKVECSKSGDEIRTEVALGEPRLSEVAPELLDVVRGRPEEEDGLEVRHGRPGAGGVVDRLHEEHLLPQQIRLAVHHAHHLHLERTNPPADLVS